MQGSGKLVCLVTSDWQPDYYLPSELLVAASTFWAHVARANAQLEEAGHSEIL